MAAGHVFEIALRSCSARSYEMGTSINVSGETEANGARRWPRRGHRPVDGHHGGLRTHDATTLVRGERAR